MAYVEILCGNFKTRKKGATFNETQDPLPTFVMGGDKSASKEAWNSLEVTQSLAGEVSARNRSAAAG